MVNQHYNENIENINGDDEIRYDDPENVDKIPNVKDIWVADKIATGSRAHGVSTGASDVSVHNDGQFQGPSGNERDESQSHQGYPINGYVPNGYVPSYDNTFYPGRGGKSPRSKLAASLLGIFLGGFGIHNFYLGRTGRGVAQLLITVLSFGMLGIVSETWGIYEGICILLSKPGSDWHRDGWGRELTD